MTPRNVTGLVDALEDTGFVTRRPHPVDRRATLVTRDIAIPWDAIAQVTTRDRSLPSSMWVLQPEETDQGTHLNVAVSGRVNVHLDLRGPLAVSTKKGDLVVTGLSLWVDEARDVATRIRRRTLANPSRPRLVPPPCRPRRR